MRCGRIVLAVAASIAMAAGAVGLVNAPVQAAGGEVTVTFPSAVSLYPHSDVKVLGLSAGRVESVEAEGNRVVVKLHMNKGVPLPVDVKAMIVPQSLIGERYVQLFPAWTDGEAKAPADLTIPMERTSVPVEPDEALAAVKRLLDSLDPNATGRLVKNLADDLDGNGQHLSDALKGLTQLTSTLAEKDQQIVGILDHLDRLSTTLRTREAQLGKVLDSFAQTAKILAEERQNLTTLIASLTDVSGKAYDLVARQRAALQKDLSQLDRLLQSVSTNLDQVRTLLSVGPTLVAGRDLDGRNEGLLAAYNPTYHLIDLRNEAGPLVASILSALNIPSVGVCLPIDVTCPATTAAATAAPKPAPASTSKPAAATTTTEAPVTAPATTAPPTSAPTTIAPTPTSTTAPNVLTPIDPILGLLGSGPIGTAVVAQSFGASPAAAHQQHRGSWLHRAARSVVEALS